MPPPEPSTVAEANRRLRVWNRKLHNYVGLYLLCFLWLFSISGLLLNHPTWEFAQFWQSREQSTSAHDIRLPPPGEDLARARDLMAQLGVSGEIERIEARHGEAGPGLAVRVVKPGRITDVTADFDAGRATVERIQTNLWGVVHWLHHFTGVRLDRPELERDWVLTRLWSLAMDALCAGLVCLVGSGLYMWYPQWRRSTAAWLSLAAGAAGCGFFLFGLGWLY